MTRAHNAHTTEDVVKRIHKEFPEYDCSETVYVMNKIPVSIRCPKHGIFSRCITKGFECKECSQERRAKAQTMTAENFKLRSSQIHGNRFEYDLVEYKTARLKVKIRCNMHGSVFEQTPYAHLNGKGCKLCANDKQSSYRKADLDHFIARSVSRHGADKFTYTKVDYKNAKTKVIVTCNLHGDFPTYPDNHWLGAGCPDCSESGFSCNRPAILYVMHCTEDNLTKIGITNSQVSKRNKALNKSYGKSFDLIRTFSHEDGNFINTLETAMLYELREKYVQPSEKFQGYSESFYNVPITYLLDSINNKIKEFDGKAT